MASLRGREEMLFASAMLVEHYVAQRLGTSLLVGVACRLQKPVRPVISFGFAGALSNCFEVGQVVDATKVVDKNGVVLWEGEPVGAVGACTGVIVESDCVVDCSDERARLHTQSGADVVDMESGIYARAKLLRGCVRVISDTPNQRLRSVGAMYFGLRALAALRNVSF